MKRLLSYASLAFYYLSSMAMHGSSDTESEDEVNMKKSKSFDESQKGYLRRKKSKAPKLSKKSKSYTKNEINHIRHSTAQRFQDQESKLEDQESKVQDLTENMEMLHSYVSSIAQDLAAVKQAPNVQSRQLQEFQAKLKEQDPTSKLDELRSSVHACQEAVERGKERFKLAAAMQAGFVCVWGGVKYWKNKGHKPARETPTRRRLKP